MNKLKELGISIFYTELTGFLFIILNKYITGAANYFPESFMENKSSLEVAVLTALLFMLLGIMQYFMVYLYDVLYWKKASILNYIIEVSAILMIFYYLRFIDTISKFIFIFILISLLFFMRWSYYYKKNKAYS